MKKIVRYLFKNGVEVNNSTNNVGNTPLIMPLIIK